MVNLVGFFGRCVVLRANLFCEGVVELFFFCRVFFVFFVNSLLFLPWAGGCGGFGEKGCSRVDPVKMR